MILIVATCGGCATLPSIEERVPSFVVTNTADTRLGEQTTPKTALHPGRSGILPIFEPLDAFAERMVLAAEADRSIDVQDYIWRGDTTGYMLFEALWKAAERGVRVRLLLDDFNTQGLDATIAALNSNPNIEVRLFNPIVHRQHRLIDYLFDFSRVNRRMHNKSMTADNQVTIVGSRNIGDEYFAASSDVTFADLDVVAVGRVVHDVSREFDLYWNSQSSYPSDRLLKKADAKDVVALLARFKAIRSGPEARKYIEAINASKLLEHFRAEQLLPFEWCAAGAFYDDPEKVRHPPECKIYRMWPRLVQAIGWPLRSMDIISPYFVPTREGAKVFAKQARQGIKIRILTNSLAATDVGAVHAGYARYRRELLEEGLKLYELKPTAWQIASAGKRTRAKSYSSFFGHSAASLHAKIISFDSERIFVGSFNMDPRSLALNTEIGILLQSPVLSQQLKTTFDAEVPLYAYEVRLMSPCGHLEWIEHRADGDLHYDTEPQTKFLRRLGVSLMSILPFDWML